MSQTVGTIVTFAFLGFIIAAMVVSSIGIISEEIREYREKKHERDAD